MTATGLPAIAKSANAGSGPEADTKKTQYDTQYDNVSRGH